MDDTMPQQAGSDSSLVPTNDQIGDDDLVIFGDNKKFYLVPKSVYQKATLAQDDAMRPRVEELVKQGVVAADLGHLCILVNLDRIRRRSQTATQNH